MSLTKSVKPNILFFNIGSKGDGIISENIIQEIRNYTFGKKYNFIYTCNKEAIIQGKTKPHKTFELPQYISHDSHIEFADTNYSIFSLFIRNIHKIPYMYSWMNSVIKLFQNAYQKYKPHIVCLNFTTLSILIRVEIDHPGTLKLDTIPTFIYQYVPGFINKTVPWIIDSRLRQP